MAAEDLTLKKRKIRRSQSSGGPKIKPKPSPKSK